MSVIKFQTECCLFRKQNKCTLYHNQKKTRANQYELFTYLNDRSKSLHLIAGITQSGAWEIYFNHLSTSYYLNQILFTNTGAINDNEWSENYSEEISPHFTKWKLGQRNDGWMDRIAIKGETETNLDLLFLELSGEELLLCLRRHGFAGV